VGDRGAIAITRLSKRDVESLLAGYDDDPVAALTIALRVVLDHPAAEIGALLAEAGLEPGLLADIARRDALVRDLNELRGLPG
jgi:hypothetical protein